MPFNITEFQGSLNRDGIQKASLYEARITSPILGGDMRSLSMRATSAELPGRTISTTEYRVYGPIRKIPYASTYTDTRIEFLCTEGMKEKIFFEKWQDLMLNTRSHQPGASDSSKYSVGYYNDFKGSITLTNYNEMGDPTIEHKFLEAYPLGIAPLAVSWDSGELLRLSVTFAFHDYEVSNPWEDAF